jgi:hypothetical protein
MDEVVSEGKEFVEHQQEFIANLPACHNSTKIMQYLINSDIAFINYVNNIFLHANYPLPLFLAALYHFHFEKQRLRRQIKKNAFFRNTSTTC